MYQPYSVRNREDYIVASFKHQVMRNLSLDVVLCAYNLAYFPIGKAKTLEFNPRYLY